MGHPAHPEHRHKSAFLRAFRHAWYSLKKVVARPTLTDYLMAIFTLAIVYLAWSGGRQTDDLITAAKRNAEAADKFAQSAASINGAVTGAVQDFKNMTAANETSAKAATDSSNTAKAALEVSEPLPLSSIIKNKASAMNLTSSFH
jgi:hypothetical protein